MLDEDPGVVRASSGLFRGSFVKKRDRSRTMGSRTPHSVKIDRGPLSDSLDLPLLDDEDEDDEEIELDEHGNPISEEGMNGVGATVLAFMKATNPNPSFNPKPNS